MSSLRHPVTWVKPLSQRWKLPDGPTWAADPQRGKFGPTSANPFLLKISPETGYRSETLPYPRSGSDWSMFTRTSIGCSLGTPGFGIAIIGKTWRAVFMTDPRRFSPAFRQSRKTQIGSGNACVPAADAYSPSSCARPQCRRVFVGAGAYGERSAHNARRAINAAETWRELCPPIKSWEILPYLALLIASAYVAFIIWQVLRGFFDQDDDQK